jgi:hypothetical protein
MKYGQVFYDVIPLTLQNVLSPPFSSPSEMYEKALEKLRKQESDIEREMEKCEKDYESIGSLSILITALNNRLLK